MRQSTSLHFKHWHCLHTFIYRPDCVPSAGICTFCRKGPLHNYLQTFQHRIPADTATTCWLHLIDCPILEFFESWSLAVNTARLSSCRLREHDACGQTGLFYTECTHQVNSQGCFGSDGKLQRPASQRRHSKIDHFLISIGGQMASCSIHNSHSSEPPKESPFMPLWGRAGLPWPLKCPPHLETSKTPSRLKGATQTNSQPGPSINKPTLQVWLLMYLAHHSSQAQALISTVSSL